MKNYEVIMNKMTTEHMAELGVKLVTINSKELYYVTSSGQLYTLNEYEQALRHEYDWLNFDPNPVVEEHTEDSTDDTESN